MSGWNETTITLRWHDDALVDGADDRCCPSTLSELVDELTRHIGASPIGSYGGGLVELVIPDGVASEDGIVLEWMRGEASGLACAADMLRARSGKLFAGGMDREAQATRQFAAEIDGMARDQRRQCRSYCEDQGLKPMPCDEDKP